MVSVRRFAVHDRFLNKSPKVQASADRIYKEDALGVRLCLAQGEKWACLGPPIIF
tara:strand:+ start:483 stop:647 length:165 start_codon:yes stop_codon:yes gene_type:complete